MNSHTPDDGGAATPGAVDRALDAILSWSLHHRAVVIIAWVVVAITGAVSFSELPLDAFPDTTPVQVHVNTTARALGPLEVERQITTRVEQSIAGLKGIAELRSVSKAGLSQVTAIFHDDVDVYLARQQVNERLQRVQLAAGIDPPTLGPVATGLGEVFHYLLHSPTRSLAELRTLQTWVVAPALRSVPGVAEVNTWGGHERHIQVVPDPQALLAHGLHLDDVVDALVRNNQTVGGGIISGGGEAAEVSGTGLITDPQQLASVLIARRGNVPIRVGDVARIVDGHALRRGAVSAAGRGEVVMGLGFALMGENAYDVSAGLGLRLAEIEKSLPTDVHVDVAYDRTDLVDGVLRTVRTNLMEGALLVIAVLFIFLGRLRAGLIVAAAIPLSLLFAFDVMLQAGVTGSLMSLGAIDFGLVVDSSVIQVENIARRLRSDDAVAKGSLVVVREAAAEVRKATIFGELIILIVYVPILTLTGVEGKLFRPMALTVICALLGSMILSLTLVPVLASLFMRAEPHRPDRHEGIATRVALRLYRPLLRRVLKARHIVVVVAAAALVGGVVLATQLGTAFVPRLSEGTIVINTVRLASVSLEESLRYGDAIERALLKQFPDEIERVWTRTGTAEIATDPMGVEVSDVFITLKDRSQWRVATSQDELEAQMQRLLSAFPGMRAAMTQPIEMRINEMVAGVRGDVAVKIFGDDLAVLQREAKTIAAIVGSVEGSSDVSVEQVTGAPVITVDVDRDAAARHGLDVDDVLDVVRALGGVDVGELQEGERRFPIVVRLDERFRHDAEALGDVLVSADDGDRVALRRVATIRQIEGPSTIQREWGKRRIVVVSNVRGRDVGGFVDELSRRLDTEARLPEGYHRRFGGQFEHMLAAQRRLMVVVPLALALIGVLLYVTYGRVTDAARVFCGVPFAVVGGVGALALRGMPLSVSAVVGFIALSGVSVLADMVLVSTVRQKLRGGISLEMAVESAAHERLRPVLMTALVAALGFVPMAVSVGVGAEVQRPLATVVIGGLVSSTALTLFVLPALYLVLARARVRELTTSDEKHAEGLDPAGE